uniref:Fras1 related extracellular matrix 1a n=1 Tax=Tetraodon nigroviridis TaxID=99883 RepID=H3CI90_TETNG
TCLWTLVPAVLLGLSSSQASLLKVNKGLKVKRGQAAFLQEDHLQFRVPPQRDACKVEVLQNQPVSQRVGKLLPQVFDCHFRSDEVKYVHNGCPLLLEDTVLLRLYRFTETETHTEVFSIHVDIVQPDCGLIKLGPKSLKVPEVYGLSDALDANVVSFHYERRSSLQCSVLLSRQDTHFPAHGQLVTGEPQEATKRGDEPESLVPLRQQLDNQARARCRSEDCLKGLKLARFSKVPCDQFLMMGLRYQHTDPPSPDKDYVTIKLELRDLRSGGVYRSEQAWIPVQIGGALPNQPPKASFMSMLILEVDQFILTPLSTATVDAEDEETPQQLLVFNITKPPADGFMAHLSDHTQPVSSFTWLDLNDMLVAYQPPNSSHSQRRNCEVELEVHDLFFERSPPVTVHMSVRSADTNAPRVSWNMGLSLLEGQSRPITWEQLQIVDNDNLDAVRLVVVDGLQHGRLTIRGAKGFVFTVSDVKAGVVRYHHDDSDTTKDYVVFRISDGQHQTRHKFPIKVLPKDDSPPFLTTNMLLEVSEGQTVLLGASTLQASDMDSSDDYILYNVTRAPRAGQILKVPGPGVTGYPVSQFLQRDLFRSTIYYRHLGNEVFDDSFEVVLSDVHEPPNFSEPQVVTVHIQPVPDQPPKEAPGSSRCLVVKETDVVLITRDQLQFVDEESPDSELIYTVTSPPFYRDPHGRSSDAGRLFLVDSIPKFTKDPAAPVLRLFTQHAVNFLKVAYMPPAVDIGPNPQHVGLVLSVTNHQGRSVTGICFNITVMPVDNQPPQVVAGVLMVDEGGESPVGSQNLLLSDVDSREEALQVHLQAAPRHGALRIGNVPLEPGHFFTVKDLRSLQMRYRHDGSETPEDLIEFTATDGSNSVPFVLEVKVNPINDEVPVLAPGLKPVLRCPEGQETLITTEFLCATDADSADGSLLFLVARQPRHGVVLCRGRVVDRFVQAEVTAGTVSYRHTGREVGLTPCHDTVTIVVSDEGAEGGGSWAEPRDSLPVYDLRVTVLPVDNQPPSLTAGEIFSVDEGGVAPITTSHLRASDEDTPLDQLVVSLIHPPQFGYIENVLPSPGFEKSNTGISIASFSYRDIVDGHVNYVQSRHQRVEPTADQFKLCVSDGGRASAHLPFHVVIKATNDEIPEFVAHNITVEEGDRKQLDLSVLRALDLDVPEDELRFSLFRAPRHGSIIRGADRRNSTGTPGGGRPSRPGTGRPRRPEPVLDFTLQDLQNGMDVTYVHDDSDTTEDSFVLRLTDGRHELDREVAVRVVPVNDQEPRLVRNSGVEVEPGEARLISSAALLAQDADTPATEVRYRIQSVPTQGLLQLKESRDWVTLEAGADCSQEQVSMNRLRYLHMGADGAKAQDFFVFRLLDGQNQSPPQHFHISVKELEKGSISVFVKPAKVSRGDRVTLTTDVLLATDGSGKPEELLYVVTGPPSHGHLEYVAHPGAAISAFSQLDVAANQVAYAHDNRAGSPRECFQFVVSNGQTSRNGSVEISVEAVDRILPSLSANRGLRVPQGTTVLLGPDRLALSDPDTPAEALTFALSQPPQYGKLLLAGSALTSGSSFTQKNIQEVEVAYQHDGGPSQIDRFGFTASDSTARGFLLDGRLQTEPVFFTVQIQPLDQRAPDVLKLLPLWKAEPLGDGRHGIFLSSRELKAQDAGGGTDEQLMFRVTRQPYFGYLENITTGGFVPRRFSQLELNKRTIVYVIDPDKPSLSDSLEFQVSDALGNTGPSHRLEFRWSSVELSLPSYFVCEEQGAVSLDIIRKGNLAESSYVTVKAEEVTATAGRDYLLSPSSLVQFDPGVSRRSWQIQILQDELEEAAEMFEVLLTSPEGAVIGGIGRAQVTIGRSGSRTGGGDASGGCRLNQSHHAHHAPVLGGREIPLDVYPQHGSIKLEKLPLGTDSLLYTRGDSIPRPSEGATGNQVRVTSNNPQVVRPSSVFHNGTAVVLTYHGMVQMQVEDDTSPSRKGRKANVRVRPAPVVGPELGVGLASELRRRTFKPGSTKGRARMEEPQEVAESSTPKPCSPDLRGLLHLNQSTNQIVHCNGVSWKRWTPTDQMASALTCPRGWTFHGGRCYILNTEKKVTWSQANRTCRERYQGTLSSVLSKADMDWLWDFGRRRPFWIGLNDREGRGRWRWAGGEPLVYTNWRRTPSRWGTKGRDKCVLVWRRAEWRSRDCKSARGRGFVCWRKP